MKIENHNPNPGNQESSLFGIFEGKAAARKAAAAADAATKIEEAKQNTLAMQALAATKGYDPAKTAIDAQNALSSGDKTLYIVLGLVVVAVMVGLYFIKRK